MKTTDNLTIDLSEHIETYPKLSLLFTSIGDDTSYKETNNKFGWDVSYAKIKIEEKSKRLIEYVLYSKNNVQISHALRIESKLIEYWRYEFVGREVNFSPDLFEPSIELFIRFYYEKVDRNVELMNSEYCCCVYF